MESRLELTVSSRAAEQHINRLQRELERLDGRGSAATAMMGKFGLALGAISAAAGGLGFSRIIRETASFEDAMLGLQAVSGATTRQMEDLEKQARTLGATSMFSAEQAGNAQRYLAQAGFEVNEVLSATPGILKLATAGQLDLATAADIASNVLGGLGLEVSELSRVNDVLAATAAGANTNIQQLGEALSYAAPFASKAGLSLEETAAAIGAMSDAGIQSSRAGTGLVGILAQLADATPKAQSAIEGAGLSMEQLDINARGLQPVLDDLRGANLGLGEALQIFGREAGAAALNVINASEGVAGFTEELRNAEGAAEEMSLIIGGGLTGSMKGFASMLSETIIGLGRDDGLAAGFQAVTDTATGMLAVYNGMLPAFAEANNLTETQTDRIETLAAGVDLLGDAAIIAAGIYTGRFVAAMAAGTASLVSKTAASVADARAEATAAQQTARRTGAELQAANAIRARAVADAKATAGTNAHAIAMQNLTAASARATAAQTAHASATNVATAAMGRASVAARGLSGAMALMGGPLGLLVGAAGLLYVFRDELNLTGQRAGLTEDQIRDLRDEMQDMSQDDLSDSLSTLNSALDTATLKAATAREELASLRADLGRGEGGLSVFREVDARHELAAASNAVADAEQRIAELNDRINVARGETASRIEQNANAYVVYADRIDEANEETRRAEEFNKTLSTSLEDAADKTYTLTDAYESLLDRITPSRREARQYAQDLGVLNLALASGRMNTTQYMQAMGMLQESFQAAQRDTDDLSKKVTDETETMSREWERFGNSVDDTLVDIVKGSFDSFNNIGDAFETLIAEMIVAAGKNEIRLRLGMGTSGPMPGGFGQLFGTGSGDGIGSLINGGRTLLGMGSATAAPSLAMQGGLSSAALASAGQVASGATYGGWAGSAASGAALGNSVAGGFMSSISAAMPWLAGGALVDNVLGLGIVDGIVSGISGLFGGKETEFSGEIATGNFAPAYHFAQQSAFGQVGFTQSGSERLHRADGEGGDDNLHERAKWAEQLVEAAVGLDNVVASLARSPAELDAMTESVNALTMRSGNAADLIQFTLVDRSLAALEAAGIGIHDAWADMDADQFSAALNRAQQALGIVTSSVDRLNLQFDSTADYALLSADNLAHLAGGLQNLTAVNDAYYNAAFSETERLSNAQQDLLASLSGVTDEAPRTVEELRAIVEAQSLNGESSAQLAYDLMALAPALKETNDAVRQAIEQQYQDALGRAPAAEGIGYWFDQVASGSLTLEQALSAIASSAEAAQYAAGGAAKAISGIGKAADALAPLESAWAAFNKSFDAERQMLESAYRDTTASINSNIQTIQTAMQKTERVASTLESTLDQMMGASANGQQSQFETASGYLRSVLSSGGLGDPGELERALSAVANPSQDTYETLQDYQRDFLSTANVVDQLRDRADGQLTAQERSVRALQDQMSQAQLQFNREMQLLDATHETQREQLEAQFGQMDWLSTLNGSVLSIADAISALDLAAAQASGSAAPSGGSSAATDPITKAYQDLLGRAPEASGYEYYASGGYSDAEIRSMIANSPEARGVPGFASGGYHMGGARIVGERGPELEVTGPSRIVSNTNTQKMFDLEPLLKEVAQLRRELAASQRAIAENTRKSARVLEREELERRQEEVV